MARRFYGVYVVLILSIIIGFSFTSCKNGGYMSTGQDVKDDNAGEEQIDIVEDLPEIESDYLYALTVKGPVKGNYLLVDCRSAGQFQQSTIPTAVPFAGLKDGKKDILPEDSTAEIIFFCQNSDCDAGGRAAALAINQGYENVKILPEGIKGWQENGYSPVQGRAVDPVDGE